ncbi:M20 family metallopeptidase [Paenibacillus filicis]|uniref:M20 family metallopeptidase n=1 Tax=Paenibacillus gyeongsangnamensis TaxID=3388067 RepID=A0ABT4QD51_9BACL|nr:M20 family metallopeptidase [Paenibacillus filicis]MCZ8514738.1 M20 family metallopeptidase [Paenibacillus filicis]
MNKVLEYIKQHQEEMLEDLKTLVLAESPTHSKERVDQCGAEIQKLFKKHLHLDSEVIPQKHAGNHMRFSYGTGDEQILILGHFDTVWDVGRLSYRVEGNRAYGPGILDMKGGIIQALWAVKACRELGISLNKRIVFLCTSDEEVGSSSSRELIEREAVQSRAVLVPEPAAAHTGALKTTRKGVGRFAIKITGKAAHAGNHHQDGISAVQEMAHQILFLHSLTDYELGTTLNVGVVRGGSTENVVAEQAELGVDLRISQISEGERISKIIYGLKPHSEGITLQVSGGVNRPPMEKTAGNEQLFRLAAACSFELGFPLIEEAVGGGSDGNFTTALGIPTLDGLGAVGEGIHAENEHVEIDQLPVRATLMAGLLRKL